MTPRFGLAALWICLLCACGDSLNRPLDIEILGLSGRADTLVVRVFGESSGRSCAGVTLQTIASMDDPLYELVWERSSQAERSFQVPSVEEPAFTIMAFSMNAEGKVIQQACADVSLDTIARLQTPQQQLTLSRRVD